MAALARKCLGGSAHRPESDNEAHNETATKQTQSSRLTVAALTLGLVGCDNCFGHKKNDDTDWAAVQAAQLGPAVPAAAAEQVVEAAAGRHLRRRLLHHRRHHHHQVVKYRRSIHSGCRGRVDPTGWRYINARGSAESLPDHRGSKGRRRDLTSPESSVIGTRFEPVRPESRERTNPLPLCRNRVPGLGGWLPFWEDP